MTLPRPVEAVAFDMDGLLVDSERVYHEVMIATAREMGHDLSPSVFLQMIGTTPDASKTLMLDACGGDFDVEAYELEIDRRVAVAGTPLKAGVAELLDMLDAARIPYALVTNSSFAAIEERVGGHGLIHRFAALVFKGEAARGKPHPDPFLLAAERMGVHPTACLALEDSHNGVRSAHAAGMMAVMVPDLLEATDEMRGLCARVAASLHEVRDLLTAFGAGPRP